MMGSNRQPRRLVTSSGMEYEPRAFDQWQEREPTPVATLDER